MQTDSYTDASTKYQRLRGNMSVCGLVPWKESIANWAAAKLSAARNGDDNHNLYASPGLYEYSIHLLCGDPRGPPSFKVPIPRRSRMNGLHIKPSAIACEDRVCPGSSSRRVTGSQPRRRGEISVVYVNTEGFYSIHEISIECELLWCERECRTIALSRRKLRLG